MTFFVARCNFNRKELKPKGSARRNVERFETVNAVNTNLTRRFTALQHCTVRTATCGRKVGRCWPDSTGTDCNQEAALGTPKGLLQLLPSPPPPRLETVPHWMEGQRWRRNGGMTALDSSTHFGPVEPSRGVVLCPDVLSSCLVPLGEEGGRSRRAFYGERRARAREGQRGAR